SSRTNPLRITDTFSALTEDRFFTATEAELAGTRSAIFAANCEAAAAKSWPAKHGVASEAKMPASSHRQTSLSMGYAECSMREPHPCESKIAHRLGPRDPKRRYKASPCLPGWAPRL